MGNVTLNWLYLENPKTTRQTFIVHKINAGEYFPAKNGKKLVAMGNNDPKIEIELITNNNFVNRSKDKFTFFIKLRELFATNTQ